MVTDIFAVIADRTRRDILDTLRTGDKAVGELVEALQASQPTVSKHLKVLRDAGLVTTRAQGQKRFYTLRLEPLGEVGGWIAGLRTTAGSPDAAAGSPSAPAAEDVAEAAAHEGVVLDAPGVAQPAGAAADERPAALIGERPAAAPAAVPALEADGVGEPAAVVPTASVGPVETAATGGPIVPAAGDESRPAQIQRTVERTVERAAARATELMANLPKFGRRR